MADVDVLLEPIPDAAVVGDLPVTVDPFVAGRTYEIIDFKGDLIELLAPGPNDVPPTVFNLSPAAGQTLTPNQPVSFDVTDDQGLFRRIFVVATNLESGLKEVVHDGDSFSGFFIQSSRRILISGGLHYDIVRHGGWTGSSIEIEVWAIDPAGNEGTL